MSCTVAFSDSAIKKYLPDANVKQLRDPRYPLRLRYNTGRTAASWYLVTHRKNKADWQKVGSWPQLSCGTVIKQLPELLLALVKQPENRLDAIKKFEQVRDVLNWYLERMLKLKNVSQHRKANVKTAITKHLLPALGDLSLLQLTHGQLDERVICPLQTEKALSTVQYVFVVLKAAFNQAAKLRLIASNPMSGVMFSDFIKAAISPREGLIKPGQWPEIIKKLEQAKGLQQAFILLLIAFATRISETRLASWSQFDFGAGLWRIPAANTKTKQAHELPITANMEAKLKAYRAYQRAHGYQGDALFPGKKNGSGWEPVSATTASRWVNVFSDGKYSAHDFRKAARSTWADLKIDYMVGERLLNHKLGKLDSAYYQTMISQPKRDALALYHEHLFGLTVR